MSKKWILANFRVCSRVYNIVHAVFKNLSYVIMQVSTSSIIYVLLRNHNFSLFIAEKRKNNLFTCLFTPFYIANNSPQVRDRGVVQQTFFVGNKFPHLDLNFRDNLSTLCFGRAQKPPKLAYPTHFAFKIGQHSSYSQKISLLHFY